MNTNMEILITIAVCAVIFSAVTILAFQLSKKKINAAALLGKIDKGLGFGQSIAEAIKPFLPGIAGNVIEIILKYAEQAVARVEATYKAAFATGTAVTDTRSAEAISMIKSALSLEGIAITNDTEKLINTVIPLLVMALPKTHDAVDETPVAVEDAAPAGV